MRELDDYNPSGFLYLAVTTAAQSLSTTLTVDRRHKAIFATIETAAIRYRIDGNSSATPDMGHQVAIGGSFHLVNPGAIANLSMAATAAQASADVMITFYEADSRG